MKALVTLKNKHQLNKLILDSRGRPDSLAINLYWDEFRSWYNPNKEYKEGNVVYSQKLHKKGIQLCYKALSEKHNISQETIRRKIVKLESLGLLSRDFEISKNYSKVLYNQLVIYIWQQTPYFYNPLGTDRAEVKELKPSTNHKYISAKYGTSITAHNEDTYTTNEWIGIHTQEDTNLLRPELRDIKNDITDIIDNNDYQENQFLKILEKNSDSFYEIYEEFLGKDPVFEAEEEINQEKLPGPIATSKTDSWRIVAKDYHKPISAAFFAENDQFIQTEMLKLQAAGYDVSETKDNHKINLNSNKDSLEKSVCLEAPKPLETKQFVETNVKRLAEESSGVEIVHSDQAIHIVQTEVKPQKQAVIHQFNPLKDRVSITDKNGNTYWGIPLSKFRYSKAMIEQIRVDGKKAHFTHERIVGLFSYIAEKYPDKLILGGKAGFISYMIKVVNGEMEYTQEEKLESIEDKRKKTVAELDRILAEGNQIQWA